MFPKHVFKTLTEKPNAGNAELNGKWNPEWLGDFSQLQIQIKQESYIWTCTARYLEIQIKSKSQFDFVPWDTEKFDFLDLD